MKYGLLTCRYKNTNIKFGNLGDDIQSLAAKQFLPYVHEFIDRDEIGDYQGTEQIKVIMNGWWMEKPFRFPPPEIIRPLFISYHLSTFASQDVLAHKGYLSLHGPIGCRDLTTVEFMKSNSIDYYFSGCLTMTLNKPLVEKTGETIVVDALAVIDILKTMLPHATYLSHLVKVDVFSQDKLILAEQMLKRYAAAKLVITDRLHAALPCLAFGTPVVLLHNGDCERFTGLLKYMRHCLFKDVLSLQQVIDFADPSQNPVDISLMAYAMRKRCEGFVNGSDSCK